MTPYRVLVVDDSAFMRKIVSDFINDDPKFTVVDTARNGQEAIDKLVQLKPDVVTMDVEMPVMNGLEALREIMRLRPTPVIMLSNLTMEGAAVTIQALEWGAFDFVAKPSGSISLDLYKVKDIILEKLNVAVSDRKPPRTPIFSAVSEIAAARAAEPRQEAKKADQPTAARQSETFDQLVAIGTSTGGPRALHHVISRLPADFAAPVLIVQHMPPMFTKSLAQRLDSVSALHVSEAEDGTVVKSGNVYIAPGGLHLTVVEEKGRLVIRLTKDEPRSGHRPSVDTLFESLIPLKRYRRHIVIMTGMGSDGAKGMANLLQSGADTTIAESEDSCVVYGMPRAAVEMQAAMHVLPQQEIPEKLIEVTRR